MLDDCFSVAEKAFRLSLFLHFPILSQPADFQSRGNVMNKVGADLRVFMFLSGTVRIERVPIFKV